MLRFNDCLCLMFALCLWGLFLARVYRPDSDTLGLCTCMVIFSCFFIYSVNFIAGLG